MAACSEDALRAYAHKFQHHETVAEYHRAEPDGSFEASRQTDGQGRILRRGLHVGLHLVDIRRGHNKEHLPLKSKPPVTPVIES